MGLRVDLALAFVVLAEELHFTRAATRLFLSQSGLSRQIRAVEKLVGTSLLARSTRCVELTSAGVALLPHAQAFLLAAGAAHRAVLSDAKHEVTVSRTRPQARADARLHVITTA